MTLLQRLGISHPVIQAPMAGVGTPALAAAVSNAGALGSLGVGAMNAGKARAAIRHTRKLTARPFNVNLFCHTPAEPDPAREAAWLAWLTPHFERLGAEPPDSLPEIYTSFNVDTEMAAMLLEERPAVVSFHFGLPPAGQVAALQAGGIVLLGTATSLEEARLIEAAGLDAVVAQGIEAGGHRGVFDPDARDERLSTLSLTRLLARETRLPVIAAGGIMDGAGIAAMLAAGAQAVQMGTAFIACPEADPDEEHLQSLLSRSAGETALMTAISGRPARGIVNEFTALETQANRPPVPAYPFAYVAAKALSVAAKQKGQPGYAVQWAGQGARHARNLPAAELVARLVREMEAAIEAVKRV